MKYFEYQYSGSFGEVWNLFSDLASLSKDFKESNKSKERNWDFSHTSEIVNSAMNGNLSNKDGEFDLRAYEIKCAQTDEIELSGQRKKFLTVVDTVNGSDEDSVGYGEISINDSRLRDVEDAFELLDNSDEFEKCLKDLYNIRTGYIVDKGIDPVEMLLNSLKGVPEAVISIQTLVQEDLSLRGIVQALCENGNNSLQVRLEGAF